MKRRVWLSIILAGISLLVFFQVVAGESATVSQEGPGGEGPSNFGFDYTSEVAEMVAQVQETTLYSYTGGLSGEWPVTVGGELYTITTRHTASGVPIEKATQYAYEFLDAQGLDMSYQYWQSGSYLGRNVIGELEGRILPDEVVLITAHIDDMPPGDRAPGADDNASGSVGVLVAAEILSEYDFWRTVRFVLFTGEEQWLHGSRAYAASLADAGEDVVAVYNMDMIAWDEIGGPTLRLHTRTTKSVGYPGDLAIANTFVGVVQTYGLSDNLEPIVDPDGITASDHSPFWNHGYPAILAIEDNDSDFNPNYHSTDDALDRLNMTYFTNFVRASVGTAAHLSVPVRHGVLLTPVGETCNGFPGQAVNHTLFVTNTGQVEEIFTVSAGGGIWSVSSIVPQVLTLDATAGSTVTVAVNIPYGILAGATDVITVTVASEENAALDQIAVTTTAFYSRMLLPVVLRT